jgi:hypothetical protein
LPPAAPVLSGACACSTVGTGISGTGIAGTADNGEEIAIVNGSNGYVYDTAAGFRQITDGDFFAANTVAYLDGFFLFDRADSDQFFRSDLLDGTAYDSTAFATKESKSDWVQAVVNVKQVLHVLGDKSSELWSNQSAANFPFQRVPGGTIDRGVIAPHALAQEDQGLFLVGDDRIAYRFAGVQPARISTHGIEREWQRYTSVSDCFGVAYGWNGHKFVVFTFPTEQVPLGDTGSWAFDISTGLWHEKLSYDINGTPLGRWCGNCVIEAYGKVLVGDAFSGKIGYLDDTVQTEFDRPMRAVAVSPGYDAGGKRLFSSSLEIDMETGVGISSGQGSDPQVMLEVSDDGGRTFPSGEIPWASLGAMGQYKTRVRWMRLGSTEPGGTRVYKVTISDPVKRTILGARAEMSGGM